MLNRRNFVLASLTATLLPAGVTAGMRTHKTLSWADYLREMKQLASDYGDRTVTQADIAAQGVQLLQQLDTSDSAFLAAIQDSYESGNHFWLWQRLTKESTINGGILNIEQDQNVPLHDHPGATGMVRVLTGEVEVWQFDCAAKAAGKSEKHDVLELVTHRIMQPGDIAVLSPDSGNIHALRAHSSECSMLDYFIPPYERSERTWYLPVNNDWHDKARISCESISENDFYVS